MKKYFLNSAKAESKKVFLVLLITIIFFSPLFWKNTGGKAFGQTYPVQISAHLIPPYSGYLPDYADPASEKLKVILQFNDFSVPHYNLRLKFEIKGIVKTG